MCLKKIFILDNLMHLKDIYISVWYKQNSCKFFLSVCLIFFSWNLFSKKYILFFQFFQSKGCGYYIKAPFLRVKSTKEGKAEKVAKDSKVEEKNLTKIAERTKDLVVVMTLEVSLKATGLTLHFIICDTSQIFLKVLPHSLLLI